MPKRRNHPGPPESHVESRAAPERAHIGSDPAVNYRSICELRLHVRNEASAISRPGTVDNTEADDDYGQKRVDDPSAVRRRFSQRRSTGRIARCIRRRDGDERKLDDVLTTARCGETAVHNLPSNFGRDEIRKRLFNASPLEECS